MKSILLSLLPNLNSRNYQLTVSLITRFKLQCVKPFKIAIAHRLEMIADYDMIVVMDQGKVVEVGPPLQLLSTTKTTGIFRGLVDELD